jgi:glyoxylase-like metal-dependent hydrolase (beta-lactamase superfamily II)
VRDQLCVEGLVLVRAPNPSLMTGSGTNTYLLGTEEVVVIDPGPDDDGHLAQILEVGAGRIAYVLVTHHHVDHAPGAARLARRAEVPLLAYSYRDRLVPDTVLDDGDEVVVPGWRVTAVHTPGHASDHLCFLADRRSAGPSATDRLLFSGDHVMGGSTVVIGPPDGAMGPYLASLRRLAALDPPLQVIAPGHGELIGDPGAVLAEYLEHRLERERLVVAALSAGPASPADLVPPVYGQLEPPRRSQAAAATIWAHLRKLGDEDRAVSTAPDDPTARWELVVSASRAR